MANVIVEIPDGEFCSDKGHLDCLYAEHNVSYHYCCLFRKDLSQLEDVTINGEKRRLRRKCNACLEALNGEIGSLAFKSDEGDDLYVKNK